MTAGAMTREQVATFFGVSVTTVRRWTRAGLLLAVPLPGRGRDAIERYDAAQVRALWDRMVAAAGQGGEDAPPAPLPKRGRPRKSRGALRLPFTVTADAQQDVA